MIRKIVVLGMAGILFVWSGVCLAGELNRYGLMVGIDKYSYGPNPLSYCVNGANGFRDALLQDVERWSPQNITTLSDSAATKTAIRANLQYLASIAAAGDVVVYYQSSHGGEHGGTSTYLCGYDANYEDFELAEDIAAFKDDVTVIIIADACYSGGLYKDALGTVSSWNFSDNVMKYYRQTKQSQGMALKDSAVGDSIGWITSCDYYQTSVGAGTYSLFTEYLLDAFSYGDSNVDGDLSFWELFSYAGPKASDENDNQTAQASGQTVLEETVAAQGIAAPVEPLSGGGGGGGGVVGPFAAGISVLLSWLKRRRTGED